MVEILKYPTINDDNIVEIIYKILNAESVFEYGSDPNCILSSSHPMKIKGVEYHSCARTMPQGCHDMYHENYPRWMIKQLYQKNPEQRAVFWHGVSQVLEDFVENPGLFQRSYSRGEFLEPFDGDLGRTSPPEISEKLKTLVDSSNFKEKLAYEWSPNHNRLSIGPHEMLMLQRIDLHQSLIMALVYHQQSIKPEYWLKKIEEEPAYFIAHFSGLGHSDVQKAEDFLEENRGKIPREAIGNQFAASLSKFELGRKILKTYLEIFEGKLPLIEEEDVERRLRGVKRALAKP